MSEAALDRLAKIPRRDDNPHIICGAVPGGSLINLRKAWVRIRTAARMPDVRLHDVRRTVGSWLVQDGSTLHLVGSVLNHKDPKTTAGYAYFQTQQREQALTRHGQQVLSFLPSLPDTQAPACYEVQPTAELPPADAPIPARRAHYLERDVLYRLVWEAPVSEVAQRLGISDVGLAKVCRRAAIPLPARGYWAKVAAGSDLGPPNLPPAPAGLPRMIRIKGHKARNANVETAATTMEPNRRHAGVALMEAGSPQAWYDLEAAAVLLQPNQAALAACRAAAAKTQKEQHCTIVVPGP